jgi:hypothetical protein
MVTVPDPSLLETLRVHVERLSTEEAFGVERRAASAVVPLLALHRTTVLRWLAETRPTWTSDADFGAAPVSFLRKITLRCIGRRFQFAEVGPRQVLELDEFWVEWLDAVAELLTTTGDPDEIVSRLTELFEGRWAAFSDLVRAWIAPAKAPLRPTVSAEYSPELQLSILGLELRDLTEPILDLGCGARAELVRYLRARGKRAVGIDRHLSTEDGARRADWFS